MPFSLTERQVEIIDEISGLNRAMAPRETKLNDLRLEIREMRHRQAELVAELLEGKDIPAFLKAMMQKMSEPEE